MITVTCILGTVKAKDHHKTEANKALAQSFVQNILIDGQTELVSDYFKDDELIQHNQHMGVAMLCTEFRKKKHK